MFKRPEESRAGRRTWRAISPKGRSSPDAFDHLQKTTDYFPYFHSFHGGLPFSPFFFIFGTFLLYLPAYISFLPSMQTQFSLSPFNKFVGDFLVF